MTTSFQSNAFQNNAFQIVAAVVAKDTHDGGKEPWKQRIYYEREQIQTFIEEAAKEDAIPEPALPVAKRLESGRVEIDWQKLERNVTRRTALLALAQDAERQRQDEEDVMILLWS